MGKTICVINGHPDSGEGHFVTALATAYAEAAEAAGHEVSRIDIAALAFDCLHPAAEFAQPPAEPIASERKKIAAADHVVLLYPLWAGSLPARVKGFLEQVGRGDFFIKASPEGKWPIRRMAGKSARLIVTMGMPALAYGLVFGAHSVKATEQGIFKLSGFAPVRHTLLGGVDSAGQAGREKMITRVRALGSRAL
jgi:putative NADPH-quinone reductase